MSQHAIEAGPRTGGELVTVTRFRVEDEEGKGWTEDGLIERIGRRGVS